MSLLGRFNRLFVLVFCVEFAPACTVFPEQIDSNPRIVTVKIKLDQRSMIIVPVSVNGAGPYDFVLDTGSVKTIFDRKLAAELNLQKVGEKTVVGLLASAKLSVVQVNSLSVGAATVQGGEVFSADHAASVTGKVRGVLGEDFLRNFDLLIDYRHSIVRLEPAPGSLAETATGEHLPLQLAATNHGRFARNVLVISGYIRELANEPMPLCLDSGTNRLILFRDKLGTGEIEAEPIWAGNFDTWTTSRVAARRIRSLDLGHSSVSDLVVIALPSQDAMVFDGLLPTSLFHSILISHSGRFAILNPSFPNPRGDALAAR